MLGSLYLSKVILSFRRLINPTKTATMMSLSFRPLFLALLFVVSTLAGTSEEGLKWLAQKKLEDGVITRDSGLMYKEVRPGKGKS